MTEKGAEEEAKRVKKMEVMLNREVILNQLEADSEATLENDLVIFMLRANAEMGKTAHSPTMTFQVSKRRRKMGSNQHADCLRKLESASSATTASSVMMKRL